MNNGEYWQKRFELLEQAAHQQGVQCYADIEKQYRQAQKQLEGQIAAWYQRFASNNGVTLAEAKRMLNATARTGHWLHLIPRPLNTRQFRLPVLFPVVNF